jgi:hypothetical protein
MAVVCGLACGAEPSAPLPPQPPLARLAGTPTLQGTAFDPASVSGKVVVVNFWSPG